MTDKNDGVLEMLDAMYAQLPPFREDEPPTSLIVQLKANRERDYNSIRDRVAELLAADEEYDAAKDAVIEAEQKYLFRVFESDQVDPAYARMEAANDRRAAAIRAMRGES